ncbi:MAG: hypothetical protein ABL998_17535 [Planctomycetota bacterium]
MNSPFAPLAVLVALLLPSASAGGDGVPVELELDSLAVTDGIRGGIIGPIPRVRLAAGYDRVERGFRAIRCKQGPEGEEVWVADLTPEQFRALLDLAVTTGLPDLPLENPPGCMDVYGRGSQIRLSYGELQWTNGAPSGCTSRSSSVVPSEDQRRRYDEVVARLEQAVDALALRPSTASELQTVQFFPDVRVLRTYRRVMAHVLTDARRHSLDLERVSPQVDRVGFGLRGRADCTPGGDVHFLFDPSGAVALVPPVRQGTLDSFSPIETGMPLTEVLLRLGTPDMQEQRGDATIVVTYLGGSSTARRGFVRPARLRFENGLLSSP